MASSKTKDQAHTYPPTTKPGNNNECKTFCNTRHEGTTSTTKKPKATSSKKSNLNAVPGTVVPPTDPSADEDFSFDMVFDFVSAVVPDHSAQGTGSASTFARFRTYTVRVPAEMPCFVNENCGFIGGFDQRRAVGKWPEYVRFVKEYEAMVWAEKTGTLPSRKTKTKTKRSLYAKVKSILKMLWKWLCSVWK
ncbi:hypothetical protein BDW62DRAFT_204560 [Aspergillus aurantiobrunneus]